MALDVLGGTVAKISKDSGPTDVNNPELDPRPEDDRPANFVSTGEGSADEYVPEDEDGEQPDPSGPTPDGEQPTLFGADGDLTVSRVGGEDQVPDGSIEDVKNWVGDNSDRAKRALNYERNNKNRSGLVSWLEKVEASR